MANSKESDVAPNPALPPAGMCPAGEAPRTYGGSGPVPCVSPSFADACKLVKAPYSCLVLETHRRHVALAPVYLKKKRSGIEDELNAELLKYSSRLKGVPLAYDDVKVLGQHGDIFDDQGYIHLNVEASFVIFKPRKGQKLVGVINKIGVGHVGCLVHRCFNACVVKPAALTPEQWRDSGLMLGDKLEFEVSQLDADGAGVLLIRGRLEKSSLEELVNSFSCTRAEEQSSDLLTEPATEPDSACIDTLENSNMSKPKKKKDKHKDTEDTNGLYVNGTEEDLNSNSVPKEKKKKKDKRKATEDLPSPTDLLSSDSSGYISDLVGSKRKERDDSLQDEASMPVAKKKKKMK